MAVNVADALRGDPATRLERRLLLEAVLERSHAWLASHPEYALEPQQAATFLHWLERRTRGEPIAYLLGRREFFGIELTVTPAVLIPRPETEGLVEWALELLDPHRSPTLLDLGTGSGAIALALHAQHPQLAITAVDTSAAALAVARHNATRWHETLGGCPITFLESHWFESLGTQRFDFILANPPYVAEGDPHLSRGDLRFEPHSALAAGPEGLDDLGRIIAQAPYHLAADGWLLLEHGYDQGPACQERLSATGFADISTRPDLAGVPRLTGGRYPRPAEQD
ncbi:MAG: peptide chain release factor N(5)-glutamine methyltransferase [Burkholderiales bacterium]